MSKVMENLTGIAVAAMVALGATGAAAAPFRVVSDAPDSVWVLDAGSGELTWCRQVVPGGPKIVDVFGDEAQARDATPRRGVPTCSVVQAGEADDPRVVRARAMFGPGYGNDGAFRDRDAAMAYGFGGGYQLDASDGTVNVIRPRYVGIYMR